MLAGHGAARAKHDEELAQGAAGDSFPLKPARTVERRVLASMGDAAFAMSSQEIATALREKIPLAVLIWEDAAHGLIKWKVDLEQHEHVDFTSPAFVAYAESFGAEGVRVMEAGGLLPALEAAPASDGVTVVACPVDCGENVKLTDRLAHPASATRTGARR